jgi:ABC-type sugar transport system permease subunit
MTGGGPASGTELMSVYIHKNTFKYLDFGYGAAMSFVLMAVCLILTVLYIRLFMDNPDEDRRSAAKNQKRRYRKARQKGGAQRKG